MERGTTIKSIKILPGLTLATLALFLLAGCVATTPERPVQDTSNLVWPPPPEEPRIRYLTQYRGQDDFGSSTSMRDRLLGEQRSRIVLDKPYGVAASADGQRIYVTDTRQRGLMVFDLEAKALRPFRTDAQVRLVTPIEVRLDSHENVYVTDSAHARVNVYSRDGKTLMSLGSAEGLKRPTGLAVDEARDRIYVADTAEHRIVVYDMKGNHVTSFGERGSDPGQLNFPVNLAINRHGEIFVVDTGNFRVQVFDPEGNFVRGFGKAGNSFGDMARPKGIAVDSQGNVYVADAAFNNFQIFDQEGHILLFIGSLGQNPGNFWIPVGMYIDEQDRIYVVDSINARIQIFQFLGGQPTNQGGVKSINF